MIIFAFNSCILVSLKAVAIGLPEDLHFWKLIRLPPVTLH